MLNYSTDSISIHALLAESDAAHFKAQTHKVGISIHALLAESDVGRAQGCRLSHGFLSTLSLRRATYDTYAKVLRVNISIHALLAESDEPTTTGNDKDNIFLSTLSLRRATCAF